MNIAEDVLRAKKDFDDVYDAGYEKGKAEGGTAKPEQEKTVTINKNGTTDVLPDDGKVLSKVSVEVDVEGEPVFYTAEGRMYKESIEIPETVTSIGNIAFANATNLRNVKISENTVTIGTESFRNCTNLEHINLPESIITIGARSFYGCEKIKSSWLIKQTMNVGSIPNGFDGGSLIYEEGITNLSSISVFNYSGCKFINEAYVYLPSTTVEAGGFYSPNATILRSSDGTCTLEVGEGFNVQIYCAQFIQTAEKWVKVGEALFDRTGLEPYTLIMGATNIAKLTDEQIAIFTNKNWTLA